MAMSAVPAQPVPRTVVGFGILVVVFLIAAVLAGQARILPAPTGLPYHLSSQTMGQQAAP